MLMLNCLTLLLKVMVYCSNVTVERLTSEAWPHWWNKKEAGVQIQFSRKRIVCGFNVSTEAAPVEGAQTQPM